jgi:hypothetical protein
MMEEGILVKGMAKHGGLVSARLPKDVDRDNKPVRRRL